VEGRVTHPPRIIFDLDGTLIDSAPDLHAAANVMLGALGREAVSLSQVKSFIGDGVAKLVERCLDATGGADGGTFEAALAKFHTAYELDPLTLTTVYPGVRGALTDLCAAGFAMGLCTNKPEEPARVILRRLGLAQYFDAVVGGDTVGALKPDPAPLLACGRALGEGPLVYVGDSETDAETAEAAEIPFLLFTEGYRKTAPAVIPHWALFESFAQVEGLARWAVGMDEEEAADDGTA
jgi:phosphoglycolate phosphatase